MFKQEIIDYCLALSDTYEDTSFNGSWITIRHKDNQQSFAHIFVYQNKLCVNIKAPPDKADFLRQVFNDVTPGHRMNKQHWNTVTTGGDVSDDELRLMITDSYHVTKPKPRPVRVAAAKPAKTLWPENFYRAVLRDKFTTVPANYDETIEYVLSNRLKPREKDIVLSRLRDGKTFGAIGKGYNIGESRTSAVFRRSIRKLFRSGWLLLAESVDAAIKDKEAREQHEYQQRRNLLIETHGEQAVLVMESIAIANAGFNKMMVMDLEKAGIVTLACLAMKTEAELTKLSYGGTGTRKKIDRVIAKAKEQIPAPAE